MSFAVPRCSASPLRLHSPPPSPSSRNIFLTQSSLLFSSSSAFLPLYVCLLPPLPSLSNPSSFFRCPAICPLFQPACPPPSYLCHPSISASLQFAPPPQYVIPTPLPTPSLSISLLSIFIYISIYILSLTLSLLSLSLTLSLSLFLLNILVSLPLNHFLAIYYWIIHSLTICSLSIYFLTLCLAHTLSTPSAGPPHPPSLLCPAKKATVALTSSHWKQLTRYTGIMVSTLYFSLG